MAIYSHYLAIAPLSQFENLFDILYGTMPSSQLAAIVNIVVEVII